MTIKGIELKKPLAKYIDHTLLKADATPEQIVKVCKEALEYDFASVCVNSCYAPLVAEQLKGRTWEQLEALVQVTYKE